LNQRTNSPSVALRRLQKQHPNYSRTYLGIRYTHPCGRPWDRAATYPQTCDPSQVYQQDCPTCSNVSQLNATSTRSD